MTLREHFLSKKTLIELQTYRTNLLDNSICSMSLVEVSILFNTVNFLDISTFKKIEIRPARLLKMAKFEK